METNETTYTRSSQRFPSPNPIGRGAPPRLPLANEGARRARRELPLGKPHDLAAPGEDRSPSPVQKSLHTSKQPGDENIIPWVERAPHGVETLAPLAGR